MTTLTKAERLQVYLPLLAQGHGYRKISKVTGLNINTVKADLRALKNGSIPHQPVPSPLAHNTPSHTPLDWNVQVDRIGSLILSLIDDAVQSGRENDACKWVDRFFKGMQARFGALRLTQNVDNRSVTFNFQELSDEDQIRMVRETTIDIHKRLDKEGVCPFCGKVK